MGYESTQVFYQSRIKKLNVIQRNRAREENRLILSFWYFSYFVYFNKMFGMYWPSSSGHN